MMNAHGLSPSSGADTCTVTATEKVIVGLTGPGVVTKTETQYWN